MNVHHIKEVIDLADAVFGDRFSFSDKFEEKDRYYYVMPIDLEYVACPSEMGTQEMIALANHLDNLNLSMSLNASCFPAFGDYYGYLQVTIKERT